MNLLLGSIVRNLVAINGNTVNDQLGDTLLALVWILNLDGVGDIAELSRDSKAGKFGWDTRIDNQSIIIWLDTEDCLRNI